MKKLLYKLFSGITLVPLFFILAAPLKTNAHAQDPLDTRISLELQQVSLAQALQIFQEKTNLNLSYANKLIESRQEKVQLVARNKPAGKLLKKILYETGLHFKYAGNDVYIYELPVQKNRVITGNVTSAATGEALIGVSVVVEGTQIGTSTDINGNFSLDVPDDNAVLVFSYIGFLNREVPVGTQEVINVELEEDNQQLNEVVVVGYGTQRKANLTGAVSQVEAEALESRPVTNISTGLQGLMPGVTVTNTTGLPGNNRGSIRIRGIGTLGNSEPLVVIDGIPGGDLDILNPNDIESISVLKDAASSSIYGVRGANGVILVTTKKGADGIPSISYSNYFGLQTPTALPEFLGSPEYMELLNEAQRNVGRNPTYTDADIETARNGSDPNYFANTNWIDEIYKPSAPQQNHNISVNGGG